ncbi:AraC family transcriptional regulator [Leptospira ognonensis]|uniref:AraC family transcriptional regulator n=1 Tax=Leptospira ognonensis TaxID=2484945 RepID=A0A4R9JY61_9LEPT|nr:AraC family transcriptional regulator [Leptospira ognonensis]
MIGSIILSSGAVQSILLALYFYNKAKSGRQLSLYLGHFFVHFTCIMLLNLAYFTGTVKEFPHIIKAGYVLGVFSAPLFYYAVVRYFGIPKERKFWLSICLLPSIILFFYCIPFFLQPAEYKLHYIAIVAKGELTSEASLLQIFTMVTNLFIFVRVHLRFREISKDFSKSADPEIAIFGRYTVVLVIWLFLSTLLAILFPGKVSEGITNIGFSFWILGFAWHRVYKDQIQIDTSEIVSDDPKYQKSFLKEDKLQELGIKLEQILRNEELILDSELNLRKLADLLGVSVHLTSQVMNRYFNQGFIEIIRTRRIEIAKRLLSSSDLPILRIGYEVGFNSKNAFIRAFKEIESIPPSEYRRLNGQKKSQI